MYLNNCVVEYDGEYCNVTGPCLVTGKDYTVKAKITDVGDWVRGKYIQDALYYLPAESREFLISGYSPEGFNQVFGDDSDED
jgi:hypothetical protein